MQLEDAQGRVLIVKASYKQHWTFPGGVIDPGETPMEAAIRETFEEVGIVVDEAAVEFVAVINRTSAVSETYQFVFKAPLTDSHIKGIILQASEISEFALVNREDVGRNDRYYGKVIEHWVKHETGYLEQTLERIRE